MTISCGEDDFGNRSLRTYNRVVALMSLLMPFLIKLLQQFKVMFPFISLLKLLLMLMLVLLQLMLMLHLLVL